MSIINGLPVTLITDVTQLTDVSAVLVCDRLFTNIYCAGGEFLTLALAEVANRIVTPRVLAEGILRVFSMPTVQLPNLRTIRSMNLSNLPETLVSTTSPANDWLLYELHIPNTSLVGIRDTVTQYAGAEPGMSAASSTWPSTTATSRALDIAVTIREHLDFDIADTWSFLEKELPNNAAKDKARQKLTKSSAPLLNSSYFEYIKDFVPYIDHIYNLRTTSAGISSILTTGTRTVNNDSNILGYLGGPRVPLVAISLSESVSTAGACAPMRDFCAAVGWPIPPLMTAQIAFNRQRSALTNHVERTDIEWNTQRNGTDGTSGGAGTSPQQEAQRRIDELSRARRNTRHDIPGSRDLFATPGNALVLAHLLDTCVGSSTVTNVLNALSGKMFSSLRQLHAYHLAHDNEYATFLSIATLPKVTPNPTSTPTVVAQ